MDSGGRWTDVAKVGAGDDSGQEIQDGLESVISIPRRPGRSPDSGTAQQDGSNSNPAGFPADMVGFFSSLPTPPARREA